MTSPTPEHGKGHDKQTSEATAGTRSPVVEAAHPWDRYVSHAKGEWCPVVELLSMHFGKRIGGWLLWNRTCFPMSDDTAWQQAKALVRTGKWESDAELGL